MGRHYSEELKKQVVEASYAEGVSVASVARRFEVTVSALYYWRKHSRYYLKEDKESVPTASSEFIPITVCDNDTQPNQRQISHSWYVTISMGSDRRVEIDGAFELPDLIKLIRGVAA